MGRRKKGPRPIRAIPATPFAVVASQNHGLVGKGEDGTAYRESDTMVRVYWNSGIEQLYIGGDIYACLRQR